MKIITTAYGQPNQIKCDCFSGWCQSETCAYGLCWSVCLTEEDFLNEPLHKEVECKNCGTVYGSYTLKEQGHLLLLPLPLFGYQNSVSKEARKERTSIMKPCQRCGGQFITLWGVEQCIQCRRTPNATTPSFTEEELKQDTRTDFFLRTNYFKQAQRN